MMEKPTEAFQCGECDDVYDNEYEALECCAPEPVKGYECPECEEFHKDIKDAWACCQPMTGPAIIEGTSCHLCFRGPLTADDLHDSGIVGVVPRCREHILAVAPELLTADAIVLGRPA